MGSSCADAWRCSRAVCCASGSLGCSPYQQAGAAGGGAAAAGSSANEASSFGTTVDEGHKSLAEMRQERQVHPNISGARILQLLLCLLQRILQPKTLTSMGRKYVSVLILHVLTLRLMV